MAMEALDDEGVSSRLLQLKVLYTFDAENKNNCLARWPHLLDVRTVFLDDNTQIGLVDLKTCIQAVTSSSPELISQLGSDYTIYAHDYSEPDIPLVGQGLLSWALSSNIPDAEVDSHSKNFVTGVVTRNGLGLFARNTQETLEVKLRLTPVPNSTQHDYLNSLQKYKQASEVIGQGFDAQAWSNFVQSNSGFMPVAGRAQSLDRSASPMDGVGVEPMQKMLSEGPNQRDAQSGRATRSGSRPPSRSATPSAQSFTIPPRQQAGQLSRPSSRSDMRPLSHQRRESFNSGYYSADETFEEGPSRKRAKVMQVDWPSKSNLNIERQPESLRVAASTASSVRLHRPIAVNPTLALQTGNSAEEPVRPPTPIPTLANPTNRRQQNGSSSLRRASRAQSSSPAPQSAPHKPQIVDTAMLSPEDTRPLSVSSSPANIPSSPPFMPHIGSLPTSPALPPLPGEHDSGFMSGNFDDFFDDGNLVQFDDYIHDKDGENYGGDLGGNNANPAHFAPVFEDGNDIEESLLPSLRQLPPPPISTYESAPPKPAISRAQSSRPASRLSISSPKLAPAPVPRARQMEEEMKTTSQLPKMVPSDPTGRPLHRSNTWAGDMSDMPTSDAVMADEPRRRPKKRVGKEQTKARLETAIAAGEMPPFCDNCGAIETPAWRRAFAKTFDCEYGEVETSLEDGAIVFKEALEHNEDGSIKTFRAFKITKKPEDRDDEWVAITLCNPCGLWFHKQKCMRPPEKWNKGPKDPNQKRKRRTRPRGERASARNTGGGNNSRGDTSTPSSGASTPQDTATEAAGQEGVNDDREGQISAHNDEADEPELPAISGRANSVEPAAESSRIGDGPGLSNKPDPRAVQSSPARPHDSEAGPIELDLTPKPLRRQLFSPQNPNSAKSATTTSSTESSRPLASLPNFVRRSPRLNKTKEIYSVDGHISEVRDKENVTPSRGLDDGLNDLFGDGDDGVPLPSMTPTPTRRSDRLLFKTPSKTPTRAPGATLSPSVRVSTKKANRHPAAAALLGTSRKIEDMTPFSKQIHQILSDPNTHQLRSSPQGPSAVRYRRSPRKASPKSASDFDFPDLPSLPNSSPMCHDHHISLNFSELTTEQLQTDLRDMSSSDRPMPSSPPPGFFGFPDAHDEGMNGLWSQMDFGISHSFLGEMQYPDPTNSPQGSALGAGPRRSPRNK